MQGSRGKQAMNAGMTGKGGEFVVAGQLLLRGVNVYFPAADYGVDLIAGNGCRIQVKTASLRHSKNIKKWYNGVYSFHFRRTKFLATSSGTIKRRTSRKFSDYCDIVILFGVDDNRFWIIPSQSIDGAQTVFMGPDPSRAYEQDANKMRSMRAEGLSTYQIAEKMGLHQSTVWERLSKLGTPAFGKGPSAIARLCENAWHHVIDFGKVPGAVVPDLEVKPAEVDISAALASLEKG